MSINKGVPLDPEAMMDVEADPVPAQSSAGGSSSGSASISRDMDTDKNAQPELAAGGGGGDAGGSSSVGGAAGVEMDAVVAGDVDLVPLPPNFGEIACCATGLHLTHVSLSLGVGEMEGGGRGEAQAVESAGKPHLAPGELHAQLRSLVLFRTT